MTKEMKMQNPQTSPEQQYAQDLIKRLQEGSQDLTDVEKSLGKIYMETQQGVMQASQEADRIEKQIRMNQERLAQLRETIHIEMGKGAGILESLVSLRPQPEEQVDKGNGKTKKPAPQKKEEAQEGAKP